MKKLIVFVLVIVLLASTVMGCQPKEQPTTAAPTETTTAPVEPVNNTPLVVGYAAFSQRFSPFFATTAYDMDAQSLTQVSLLKTDRTGGIIYNAIEGETHSYNGVDYFYDGISNIKVEYDEVADITTYNIKSETTSSSVTGNCWMRMI